LYNAETKEFETLQTYNEETERQKQELETNAILLLKEAQSVEEVNNILETVPSIAGEAAKRLNELSEALDEEVDKDEWEDLIDFLQDAGAEIEGVSDEIKLNERAAKRAAQGILRFDNAVEEVTEHYDDWMHALESGNTQELVEATNQMRDTYQDLLDLPFDTFSADFL
jgi:methyl-accepting chemotaxis protein